MAGEPYAANGHSRYETEFRNESGHNSRETRIFQKILVSNPFILA
jgi:hypothetical protein